MKWILLFLLTMFCLVSIHWGWWIWNYFLRLTVPDFNRVAGKCLKICGVVVACYDEDGVLILLALNKVEQKILNENGINLQDVKGKWYVLTGREV